MDQCNSFHILINKYSGTVNQLGQDALTALIEESQVSVKSLNFLSPDEIFDYVRKYETSEYPILIGGGDGTIKGCANILRQSHKPFGILPLGTMNLLARDLGIEDDLINILNGYAAGFHTEKIDIGAVNAETFLCCVGIGTMPETSEFREENRAQNPTILMPRLTVFVLNQMNRMKQRTMRLTMNNKTHKIKTAALVISNNKYSAPSEWTDNNFKRHSLKDGKLGIYSAAPLTFWDRIRLLFKLRFGNWKKDSVIKEWEAQALSLSTKNKEELISLDGETQSLTTPLDFEIYKDALSILLPSQI